MDKRALLVIDLQKGVQAESTPLCHLDQVISGVNQRIRLFREQNKPVIFIQHNDDELVLHSDQWALFAKLDHRESDIYVSKTHANAFYHTDLKERLDALQVNQLEICGAQTEYCVDTTIRMAHGLGYKLFMKRGLSTTVNNELLGAATIIRHHEQIWDQRFLTFI